MFLALAALIVLTPLRAEEPGRMLFSASGCLSCHRIAARGGNSGPDLTLVGFRRSRQWLDLWLKSPRAWKKDTLMPQPSLSESTRGLLVDYLSGQKGQGWESPPWAGADAEHKGRLVFTKAGCIACHGAKGKGGHPNNNVEGGQVPALPALVATYTDEELRSEIRDGDIPEKKDPAGPAPLVVMPAWGQVLKEEDIAAVAAYLRTLTKDLKPMDW